MTAQPSSSAPAIEIIEVSKAFGRGAGRTLALDAVNLAAHPGEMVMLMGPSGSGKTTLLSIMGCILTPDSGVVRVAGRDTVGLDQAELARIRLAHIGFIFQEYHLFPTLTAVQNVMVALDLKNIRGDEAREHAAELLQSVGLGERLHEYPANLSGGQKQRLAIARALGGDPEVILADEPTAALDSENGKIILEILLTLSHHSGRTVVIVTHDTRIVPYADRIIRIEDGRISGSVRQTQTTPGSPA